MAKSKQPAHTAGIILAAGMSKRFKSPKQILKLDDRYLVEWVLDAAVRSSLTMIYLVVGHESMKILNSIDRKYFKQRVKIVHNAEYAAGMSTSLHAGLSQAKDAFTSVMYLLGDQPMIDSLTIDLLLNQFHESDKDICQPVYRGRKGNPVIIGHNFYKQVLEIRGDHGARFLIRKNPDRIHYAEIENPLCFFDIDTIKDIEVLNKKLAEIRSLDNRS